MLYDNYGMIPVLDSCSCVLKSDTAIPVQLKNELKNAVAALEALPEQHKDWHPGSDGKVLDLVHPSLYPLVHGRSRVLPNSTAGLDNCVRTIGKGRIIPPPSKGKPYWSRDYHWSDRFQWLPCDVSFQDGTNAKIESYINNLHPVDHRDIYMVIEKIITKAIPFWNIVCQCWDSTFKKGRLRRETRICDSLMFYVRWSYGDGSEADDSDTDQDAHSETHHSSHMDVDGDIHSATHYSDSEEAIKPDGSGLEPDEDALSEASSEKHDGQRPSPREYEPLFLRGEDIEDKFTFLGDGERKIQVRTQSTAHVLAPLKMASAIDRSWSGRCGSLPAHISGLF